MKSPVYEDGVWKIPVRVTKGKKKKSSTQQTKSSDHGRSPEPTRARSPRVSEPPNTEEGVETLSPFTTYVRDPYRTDLRHQPLDSRKTTKPRTEFLGFPVAGYHDGYGQSYDGEPETFSATAPKYRGPAEPTSDHDAPARSLRNYGCLAAEPPRHSPGTDREQPAPADQPGAAQDDASAVELAKLREALARAQQVNTQLVADIERMRSKTNETVKQRVWQARASFIRAWLAVVDSVDRAIKLSETSASNDGEGWRILREQMANLLRAEKVEAIDCHNQIFDPHVHEAVSAVPMSDVEDGTIIDVVEQGYTLDGQLLRPARVVVARIAD